MVNIDALINIQPDGKNFHVWYYDEQGKKCYKYVTDFEPYFYSSQEDRGIFAKETEVTKHVVSHPKDVVAERAKYPFTAEADILYHNRYLIDKYFSAPIPKSNFRLAFFDIENLTDEEHNAIPNVEKAEFPIVAISVWDNWTSRMFSFAWHETETLIDNENGIYIYRTELEMIGAFLRFWRAKSFDVISGWNSAKYDVPYIVNRFKKYGMESGLSPVGNLNYDKYNETYNIGGISHIDYQQHCKKRATGDKESWSLQYVANEFLGTGKMKLKESINKTWKNDIMKLIEYNRRDVELLRMLEYGNGIKEHKGEHGYRYIELADELRRIGRVTFDDTTKNSRIYDNMIICKLRSKGKVVKTNIRNKEEESFDGAFVKEPTAGIYDWVIELDATGQYAAIIIGLNISPEVKSVFDGKGIIPEILEEIVQQRNKYKEEYKITRTHTAYLKQWAYKILANSLYGVLGYHNFRLYDLALAAKVTETGRKVIKFACSELEKRRYEVIYADTDSVFLSLKVSNAEEAKIKCQEIQDLVNHECMPAIGKELGIKNNLFHFKQEVIARKAMFLSKKCSSIGAKKRYVLWIVNDEGKDMDEMRYVGLEVVRSDTPAIARHFLKKFYAMILKGTTIEEINAYVKDFIAKIRVALPEEIALPTTIKKPLEMYKGNSIHVAGARYWNKYFYPKIIEGSKIKYLYVTVLNGNNYDQTHVISLPEGETLPSGFAIEYDKMIDRLVNMKIDEALKIYKQKDEKKFW